MTSVWPALWPPWKRTTTSARLASQSTILPLPSSPHWAPTTVTLAKACCFLRCAGNRARRRRWGARGQARVGPRRNLLARQRLPFGRPAAELVGERLPVGREREA